MRGEREKGKKKAVFETAPPASTTEGLAAVYEVARAPIIPE